jgi:hypothetical protein
LRTYDLGLRREAGGSGKIEPSEVVDGNAALEQEP